MSVNTKSRVCRDSYQLFSGRISPLTTSAKLSKLSEFILISATEKAYILFLNPETIKIKSLLEFCFGNGIKISKFLEFVLLLLFNLPFNLETSQVFTKSTKIFVIKNVIKVT